MTAIRFITNSFFFFQAEDGIRDRNVTGVQTCALPISSAENATQECRGESVTQDRRRVHDPTCSLVQRVDTRQDETAQLLGEMLGIGAGARQCRGRSEERRVGKGWRWRRSAERRKEKQK